MSGVQTAKSAKGAATLRKLFVAGFLFMLYYIATNIFSTFYFSTFYFPLTDFSRTCILVNLCLFNVPEKGIIPAISLLLSLIYVAIATSFYLEL